MSNELDKQFFRNFTLVVIALAVMMVVFLILAFINGANNSEEMIKRQDVIVAERTAPMGKVSVAGEEMMTEETAMEETMMEETAMEETMQEGVTNVASAAGTDTPAMDTAVDETALTKVEMNGEKLYNQICVACHSIDGIGSPVLGDIEAWAPRIAKGVEVLYENAINGYVGPEGYMMPARGGANFTDEQVRITVDYMVEKSQ